MNTPGGLWIAAHFMWADDDDENSSKWLSRIASFGKVVRNGMRRTTMPDAIEDIAQMAPKGAFSAIYTISLGHPTKGVIHIIAKNIAKMPTETGADFAIHMALAPTRDSLEGSVYSVSAAHLMLESIATRVLGRNVQMGKGLSL